MPKGFTGKVSWFFAMLIIGAIILSFALTGFNSNSSFNAGTGQTVAKVDGTPIGSEEFQRAYQNQISYYSKLMGGKELNSREIEMFNIKHRALQMLVSQKLLVNWASDLGLEAGTKEIQEEIKSLPYFKTNDVFDVSKYKELLKLNKFSPKDFESKFAEDLKAQKINAILGYSLVSDNYLEDYVKYKNLKTETTAVRLYKSSLRKHIKVSQNEIKKFVNDSKNSELLKTKYESSKSEFKKEDQVEVAHILLKVNKGDDKKALEKAKKIEKEVSVSNFSKLAAKYTDDLVTKGKGGNLGKIVRGVMPKEFDKVAFNMKKGTISKPVKTSLGYHVIYLKNSIDGKNIPFQDARLKIAEEIIRENKTSEIDKIAKEVTATIGKNIKNAKKLNDLKKIYDFDLEENKQLNRLEGKVGTIELKEDQLKAIFPSGKAKYDLFNFNLPAHVLIVKTSPVIEKKDNDKKKGKVQTKEEKEKAEINMAKFYVTRKIQDNIMKELQDKAKVVTYAKFLD